MLMPGFHSKYKYKLPIERLRQLIYVFIVVVGLVFDEFALSLC